MLYSQLWGRQHLTVLGLQPPLPISYLHPSADPSLVCSDWVSLCHPYACLNPAASNCRGHFSPQPWSDKDIAPYEGDGRYASFSPKSCLCLNPLLLCYTCFSSSQDASMCSWWRLAPLPARSITCWSSWSCLLSLGFCLLQWVSLKLLQPTHMVSALEPGSAILTAKDFGKTI